MTTIRKILEHMIEHPVHLYQWQLVYTAPNDHIFMGPDGIISSIYYNSEQKEYSIQYQGGHSQYLLTIDSEVDIEAFQLLPISM